MSIHMQKKLLVPVVATVLEVGSLPDLDKKDKKRHSTSSSASSESVAKTLTDVNTKYLTDVNANIVVKSEKRGKDRPERAKGRPSVTHLTIDKMDVNISERKTSGERLNEGQMSQLKIEGKL